MRHSKIYRNDGVISIPARARQYLDTHFLPNLPNVHVPHPKLLVVFSGGNAMGKSAISAKLGQELQALVLENDDVRRHLVDFDPNLDQDKANQYMWQYMLDTYKDLDKLTPNGLVVRDGIIDWYYDKILPLFKRQGYEIFIIAFDVSREKRIELLKQKGDTKTAKVEYLLRMVDDHIAYEHVFRKEHTPDLILRDDNLFDHEAVVQAVRERLRQLA